MTLDLSWVLPEHQERSGALVDEIARSCESAEKSKAFLDLQLNPRAEWRGWPAEVAEAWLATRPTVVADYFSGGRDVSVVGRAVRKRLRDVYRPQTGKPVGRPPREPQAGLEVPPAVSGALDDATWDAMGRMGGRPDLDAIRQAVKIPAPTDDEGDDIQVVIRSAGTVTGRALEARYTSIRGDLYWADIRNSLEVWIMARPELIAEFVEWDAKGEPRAWEEGGVWISRGDNDRREHNPLVHIRTSAFRTALKAISHWRNEGVVSLDAILAGGEESLAEVMRPKPQRVQHKPAKDGAHYAWGLRDDVNCYSFPVDHRLPDSRY
jgi:hypothetical protein